VTRTAPSQALTHVVGAQLAAAAARAQDLPPPTGVELAFAGRSNVGKSSLMNCLLERKNLVRTSSTPGCTRQVALFEARTSDGALLTLADLPGYGYAKRSKSERQAWAELVERYLLERATLAVVVVVVDVRRGLEADDLDLLKMLAEAPRVSRRPLEVVLVGTKLDKLPASAHKPALERLRKQAGRRVIGFSAKTKAGRDELWRALRRAAGLGAGAAHAEPG
jgi:GTP-binding protein